MRKAISKNIAPVTMNISECIAELSAYGYPHMWQRDNDNTWVARVEMKVTSDGVTFDIKANGNSLDEALNQCVQRMKKALEDLK